MTTRLLEAELALRDAFAKKTEKPNSVILALQAWISARFPEVTTWLPAPGDFVRWNSSHPNRGQIDRVISPVDGYWVELPDVFVSTAFLEPWVPWVGEFITCRDGHALAGYSYQVIDLYRFGLPTEGITHVKVGGITFPVSLSDIMPCQDKLNMRLGPGASGNTTR